MASKEGVFVDVSDPKKPKILWEETPNPYCLKCDKNIGTTPEEIAYHEPRCISHKIDKREAAVHAAMKLQLRHFARCRDARATAAGQMKGEQCEVAEAKEGTQHTMYQCTSCAPYSHYYNQSGEHLETCQDCQAAFTHEEMQQTWSYHDIVLFLGIKDLAGYDNDEVFKVMLACPDCRMSRREYQELEIEQPY
jgi:hypothetical protein